MLRARQARGRGVQIRAMARCDRRRSSGDPNYSGYCVPPYEQGDVDCADIPVTVRVVGSGPHRLDGDGDGYGCE